MQQISYMAQVGSSPDAGGEASGLKALWSFQKQILDLFHHYWKIDFVALERYFQKEWQKNNYRLDFEKLAKAAKEFKQSLEQNEAQKVIFAEMIKKYRILTRKFLLSLGQSKASYRARLIPNSDLAIQVDLNGVQYILGWQNDVNTRSSKRIKPTLLKRQQQLAMQMQKMLAAAKKMHALVQTKVDPGLNQDLILSFVEKLANALKEISLQFGELLGKTMQANNQQNQDSDPIEMTLLALVAMDLKNLKPQMVQISNLLKKYIKEGTLGVSAGLADLVSSPTDRQTIEQLAQDLI